VLIEKCLGALFEGTLAVLFGFCQPMLCALTACFHIGALTLLPLLEPLEVDKLTHRNLVIAENEPAGRRSSSINIKIAGTTSPVGERLPACLRSSKRIIRAAAA